MALDHTMSGLSSTLSSLAKRSIPITTVFNDLVRGIGESKSKDEEDSIVAKMVELCRTAVRSGRRDPRSSKEFLLYLIYIDMLGHDTRWAHASVIQLCSDKSLVVKKVGVVVETQQRWAAVVGQKRFASSIMYSISSCITFTGVCLSKSRA